MTGFVLASVFWRVFKIGGIVLAILVLAVLGFVLWAAGGDDEDEAWVERAIETSGAESEEPPSATPEMVNVLCWNMAYGRGPKDDIGDRRDRGTIEADLEGIADAIVSSGADIVALQEVDFDARRTYHIDEVAFLMARLGWKYAARVTTWKNNYVPYPYWPPSQHIGAIHSGQAVLSRFPITRNARLRYPQPEAFAFWYNAFYLHRATQVVDVKVGERTLTLLNTHLEAFDETNRERQARMLVDLGQREMQPYLLVLGDFNAPPPEAKRMKDFPDEPGTDFTDDETIAILRQGLGLAEVVASRRDDALSAAEPRDPLETEIATYTFPWEEPTRQLDHVFFGRGLALVDGGVWRPGSALSDHLPIRAKFRLLPAGAPDGSERTPREDGSGAETKPSGS